MPEKRNKIMDATEIQKTVKRIAYQIYETHFEESQLILAGIANNGVILAKRIQEELESISKVKVVFVEIKVDKKNPIRVPDNCIANCKSGKNIPFCLFLKERR